MIRSLLATAAVLTALVGLTMADDQKPATAAATTARASDAITVDMKKPLPKTLELVEGQTVTFENGSGKFSTTDTDGKGALLAARPHNTFNQAASYRASRVGSGKIDITLPSQGLLTVIKTHSIAVTVKAASKTASIAYNQLKTAADVEINVGDSVNVVTKFSGDVCLLEEPNYAPTLSITDGKTGEVISGSTTFTVTRVDKDTVRFWNWDAKREGTAEITFKNVLNGKTVKTIKVTVKK